MTRANRVTVQSIEGGYKATFYRTHKLLATINSMDTAWQADANANSTTNRESFRAWICEHSAEWDIEWNPSKQTQAWDRKYNTYMTDEQVAEDTITLITPALNRLAEKCKYNMEITGLEVAAIYPVDTNLTYVKDGRYTKSGAWCAAQIEVSVTVEIAGQTMDMVYMVNMKSGQICKPKTTIAEWNELVGKELELNGITIEQGSDSKTA
jgi:hypothetical protein